MVQTKLFSGLYPAKFLVTSTKPFFPCLFQTLRTKEKFVFLKQFFFNWIT